MLMIMLTTTTIVINIIIMMFTWLSILLSSFIPSISCWRAAASASAFCFSVCGSYNDDAEDSNDDDADDSDDDDAGEVHLDSAQLAGELADAGLQLRDFVLQLLSARHLGQMQVRGTCLALG